MASDEIAYNSYFHILQEKFRPKYEEARANSWLICIPSTEALRGVEIDEQFVDLHILQPILDCDKPNCYASTDSAHSHVFELDGDRLSLLVRESEPEDHTVQIIAQEIGYNKMYQPYKLLITDHVLSPLILAELSSNEEWLNLNGKIFSLIEVEKLLLSCPHHIEVLPQLDRSVRALAKDMAQVQDPKEASSLVHKMVRSHWTALLPTHPLYRQRDARFQLLLSTALENYVVHHVHEQVFSLICSAYVTKDSEVHELTSRLSKLGVSPDQLGAPEDFAVPLPAAVVELAALDSLHCPIEKLSCLRTSLDLILAQVKAALVDVQALSVDDDCKEMPLLASDDFIPLLVAVLVQAKPLHLVSNLFYMEHFQWTLSPNDALSFALVTFKAALLQLLDTRVDELRPRSSKVHRELALQDLILVTGEVMEQPSNEATTPLDRQLQSVTAMIEASTRETHDPQFPYVP